MLPTVVGIIPFGLVAGATPVAEGLGGGAALGFSTLVFAGASQLAAIEVLGDGGSTVVAVLAAWTINLRMLLYSASLAPHLAAVPLRTRLGLSYLLVDQVFALSAARWSAIQEDPPAKVAFYLGAAVPVWVLWQLAVVAGALGGSALPKGIPLDFAVALVFLVLLVPAVTSRPALAAAIAGGAAAVGVAEAGAPDVSVLAGALCGIAAGAVAEILEERGAPRPPDGAP